MDKSTISKYGSIVAIVVVIAIVMAFAAPFGNLVKAGVLQSMSKIASFAERAEDKQLDNPKNLVLTGTTLTFDAVENADGYKISINGATPITTTNTTVDLTSALEGLVGNVTISVAATDSTGTYKDGKSATLDYNHVVALGAPSNLSVTDKVLTFDAVPNADGYAITVNGGTPITTTNTTVDLTEALEGLVGSVTITVAATDSTGTYEDSTAATLDYNHVVALGTPSNLSVTDNVLTFDAVANANSYIITVNGGTPFTSTTTTVDLTEALGDYTGSVTVTVAAKDTTGTYVDSIAASYTYTISAPDLAPGLYQTGTTTLLKSWDDLVSEGTINVSQGVVTTNYDRDDMTNLSTEALDGDLIIPDNITELGPRAFYDCWNLTNINIPDSVTNIGDYALSFCSLLSSITVPDGVTSIGRDAFKNCTSLTNVIFGENSQLESIGKYAFSSCRALISVTIPDSVTNIGEYAFAYCGQLPSIAIPDGVTDIGPYVFHDCRQLTNITIPDSVTTIGVGAFANCESLISITFEGTMAQWNTISFGSSWNLDTGNYIIHCTNGDIAKS